MRRRRLPFDVPEPVCHCMFRAVAFIPSGIRLLADSLNDSPCATSSATRSPVLYRLGSHHSAVCFEERKDYASKQSAQHTAETMSTRWCLAPAKIGNPLPV